MESITQKEIEAKAGEKKLFSRFDVEDLDTYMSLIIKMKVQTDNLYVGNQRALKDIAILYKRVQINGTDLLNHLDQGYLRSDTAKLRKAELVKSQVTDAEKTFKEVIGKINMSTQSTLSTNFSSTDSWSNQSQQQPQQYNAFSYMYDPNAPKQTNKPIEQQKPQTPSLYPTLIGGAGAVGGASSLGGTAVSGYASLAGTSLAGAGSGAINFSSTMAKPSSSSLYPDLAGTSLQKAYSNPNQSSGSFYQAQGSHLPAQHSNSMYQTFYNQNYQNPQQPQSYQAQSNLSQTWQLPQYGQQSQIQQQNLPQTYAPQQPTQTWANQAPQVYAQQPYSMTQQAVQSQQSQNTSQSASSYQTNLGNLNKQGQLRTVYCPNEIVDSFIKIAQSNTSRKMETCAILAGSERNNAFIIDTLIVPTQEGHEDHCFMTDEIQLFEAQIKHKVITIGWIHTHPQYSLFLSSVDLHNQLGYQMQLPEAVAIVYSPIEQERFKAFRVKDERVTEIKKCSKTNFHEHKDNMGRFAFEQCQHLVYVNGSQNNIKIKTVDLR